MAKVCDKFCKDCVFFYGWYRINACCNYIFMEGKSRGCDPGKGCTQKKKKSKRGSKKKEWIDWQ